jgi:CDGSH-type Zn-finger protein/truncated hemoglobin YjbI
MTMDRSRRESSSSRVDDAGVAAVRSLRMRVKAVEEQLTAAVAAAPDDADAERARVGAAAERLSASVLRPLDDALGANQSRDHARATGEVGRDGPAAVQPEELEVASRLWELAKDATAIRSSGDVPNEVIEATAALQDLVCDRVWVGGSDEVAARCGELREMQAGLAGAVRTMTDGPYLVTNADNLRDWLGEVLPTRPQMALCRCGESRRKPLCDGTHARTGFSDAKAPHRVPDRRNTYVGQQVTILDNRGTCQHSGFCTDRLAAVFHLGQDPFVTPSGGRMDEIIRAVRDCPSGALSYAIDGIEARDNVDYHASRQQTIEVSRDGPYRISGGIPLIDAHGEDVVRNDGASSEHYALCRCGHSQNKPFCSGMHWYVDFHDPVADTDHEATLFEWAGGLPALTRMTRIFYEKYVPEDTLLAPLFADMSTDHPQRVAKWLAEVFCGPKRYSNEFGGYARMISQHMGKGLREEQRSRWVSLIIRSAHDAGLPNDAEFRSAFGAYIEWGSRLAVENSQPGAHPPPNMPMPHWDWNTAAGPPGSRMSALGPPSDEPDQPAVLPSLGEAVGFDKHIKTLFRQRDRQSMKFAFDLWDYGDVTQHADAVLERLRNGTMPCDGAWPKERVDVFQHWVDTGKAR